MILEVIVWWAYFVPTMYFFGRGLDLRRPAERTDRGEPAVVRCGRLRSIPSPEPTATGSQEAPSVSLRACFSRSPPLSWSP